MIPGSTDRPLESDRHYDILTMIELSSIPPGRTVSQNTPATPPKRVYVCGTLVRPLAASNTTAMPWPTPIHMAANP